MFRPRIGIFDLACCEGCQLQIVNMEQDLLQLLTVINPVEWREAMSDKADDGDRLDIALVEGSVTREADADNLRAIRERTNSLIAMGACAATGGINLLKNNFDMGEVRRTVYGDAADMPHLDTSPTRALHEVVKVDYTLHGCPIDIGELAGVIKTLLVGKTPTVPDHPVCVECKLNENPCRYDFGEVCLGPLTRAGCDARCPSEGAWCFGCRGQVSEANLAAAEQIMAQYGKTVDDLHSKMLLFNSPSEVGR